MVLVEIIHKVVKNQLMVVVLMVLLKNLLKMTVIIGQFVEKILVHMVAVMMKLPIEIVMMILVVKLLLLDVVQMVKMLCNQLMMIV